MQATIRAFVVAALMASAAGTAMAGKPVGEGSLKGEYPLTRSGTLHCKNNMVWIETSDGQTWAVNGTAKAKHQAIEPIWKKRKDMPSLRVSISELIEEGRKLCD